MKKINLLIAAMFLVFVLPMVIADSTNVILVTPASGHNYTDSISVQCNYTNGTDITSPLSANSNWTYNLSGTWTVMAHTGFVCSDTECNATIDTSALTDGAIYGVKCTLGNATASNRSATNGTNIMFDNTDPVCNIGVDHSKFAYKGIQDIEWDSTDAIERVSTSVTIDGPGKQTTASYTDANRNLTLTSQDTKYIGDWTATIGTRDRVGNTCNTSVTFKTYLPDGDITEGYGEETETNTKVIIVVVILAILAYLILGKK